MYSTAKQQQRFLMVGTLALCACSAANTQAQVLTIPHPDDAAKTVEAFIEKPAGSGPWPTVVLLHGYQSSPSAGGKDFVEWGVLDKLANRGYLAVAVSQPGFGNSTGPADFCGLFTQNAVLGVLDKLTRDGYVLPGRVVIEGISRGALVAGLIATRSTSLAGVVLISGLYDLREFVAEPKSGQARLVVSAIMEETGGATAELQARSVLYSTNSFKAPALIMNGARDDRTDPVQAQRLAEELTLHGGKARAIIYPEYGHQIPVEVRDVEIDPFIDSLLKDH